MQRLTINYVHGEDKIASQRGPLLHARRAPDETRRENERVKGYPGDVKIRGNAPERENKLERLIWAQKTAQI
jgi:hypothetical protein